MAEGGNVLGEIDRAFRQEGFERDWNVTPKVVYRGQIRCINSAVSLSVHLRDLDFLRAPRIRVENLAELPRTVLPHISSSDGNLCYIEGGSTTLDRYDPEGTIVFCLRAAKQTLEDAISGKSAGDIAAEFFAYWGEAAFVDLPKTFQGESAFESWIALRPGWPEFGTPIITPNGDVAEALLRQHLRFSGRKEVENRPCTVLRLPITLSVGQCAGKWPPTTLAALLEWLGAHAAQFSHALRKAIQGDQANKWLILIRANNGDFLVRVELPAAYNTEEFTKTRRANLPDFVIKQIPTEVQIDRRAGWPIGSEYIFSRNLNGQANLSNKKILLVGCGTIGGFLAQQMAQSGAGTGDRGELHLVDEDLLGPANLGRHLLGIPHLGHNKATACRDFLLETIPYVSVRATPENVSRVWGLMPRYDLIIDTTGEDATSYALNQRAIEGAPDFPPVLFAGLLGNGAAAQALYFDGRGDHACFKCLKPIMNAPARYEALREKTRIVHTLACGDSSYIPFPVSRSVQAASLALEMTLSWAKGDLRHRFQGRVLDETLAMQVKDGNPSRSAACPACRIS